VYREAINLGTSTSVTIRELAQLMKTIKKSSSELIDVPARVGDVVYSQADISRARLLLNWSAKIDLKNGLGQLLS
jgi:UDP-glucose 4-epimerase